MKFSIVPSTLDFPILRLASERNVWEMGFAPVLYGQRVRVGREGAPCYTFDYCAGADTLFQMELLMVVLRIMEQWPENISEEEVKRRMPKYKVRPINQDPCWETLQAMAGPIQKSV